MSIDNYLYDKNHTRFYLIKSVPGPTIHNIIFLPGGPGVDSSSLLGLVKSLNAPGNYWLVDLPGNGTNTEFNISSDTFERWNDFLLEAISHFENPILIGHSFSGYLPFFCPKLENKLKGLIIIGSASTLDSDIYAKTAAVNKLPSLTDARKLFVKEKSLKSLQALYMLEAEYFFTPEHRTLGISQIIKKLKFSISAEYWWHTKGVQLYKKNITWIPQSVPTLIIAGSQDHITPLEIFESDLRFRRENIEMASIKEAGHFPWLEQPRLLNNILSQFIENLK